MTHKNVTELLQKAVAQTMGDDYYITVGTKDDGDGNQIPDRVKVGDADFAKLNSSTLVDIGRDVVDGTSVGVDVFVKSLLNQMGKMVIEAKKYTAELPSLFYDNWEWGSYLERVYFNPASILDSELYNLVDGKTYDDHKFYQPQVSAKIFQELKSIMVPISVVRESAKTAFNDMSQMNSFISGIFTTVENTVTLAVEAYAHALISVAITAASENGKTKHEYKLLSEYKALHTSASSLTPEQALEDEDFMRYALKRISEVKGYFSRFTTAFNNGAVPVFNNQDDINLALLQSFVSAAKFGVRANTFNEQLLGLGLNVDTISAWQAFRTDTTDFDFATISSVEVDLSTDDRYDWLRTASGADDAFKVTNVIGVMYGKEAMGIAPTKTRVNSQYTAIADFWTTYTNLVFNSILDLNANLVIFTLN